MGTMSTSRVAFWILTARSYPDLLVSCHCGMSIPIPVVDRNTRGSGPPNSAVAYTVYTMRFNVLGSLQAEENGEAIALGGQRQRAVLALLLLEVGQPVTSARIVSEIWPDQPLESVRDSLYTYVSQLRRVFGKSRILRANGGYRLDLQDTDEIDAVVFESTARHASRLLGSDPEAVIHLLGSSLELWRGRPYEGFEDLASLASEVARLEELRLKAVEDRLEAELLAGQKPVVADVEELCSQYPYREPLWGLLARTYYRTGRQAEALRTFTRLRSLLGDELGIDLSPEMARLEEQILLQDPILEPDAAPPPTNLPVPVSSFVGRVDELTVLDKDIHDHRLVTVVGPGGAGKTRLAIEAARKALGSFRDGVWLADLAQISQSDLVPQVVAASLQIAERSDLGLTDSIAAYLRPRSVLIVLDNCEHVADAAATLATNLLQAAPNVTILVTSRQSLNCPGEVRFLLEGLATFPDGGQAFEAERLFEARAAAVRRGFALDDTNRGSVDSICRHLDGMPLAIELAAARVDTLSPLEIEGHLARRFALLSSEPMREAVHHSLRASMDWSYELLPATARNAFDAFGVFEGPFSSTAAAAVAGLEPVAEVVDQVRLLVSASLLQVVPTSGASLYRLLETPRLYARDHLIEAGLWEFAVERHDAHYRDECGAYRPAFFGRDRVAAQREIEVELADYHAAFDRSLDVGKITECLEMAWPLGHLWLFTARLDQGERRLTALLEASAGAADRLRADALTVASFLAVYRQRFGQGVIWADEAIEIYRAIGDDQGLAYALSRRGHIAFGSGDGPTAVAALQASLELCQAIGYEDGTAWPITLLAQARLWSGDESPEIRAMTEEGRERFIAMGELFGRAHADMILGLPIGQSVEYRLRFAEEMVQLSEQPGADRLIRANALHGLAYAVWDAGERERAEGLNRAAARAALDTGDTVHGGLALLQAARFAGELGAAERAAILFGAGDTHFAMQKAPFMERIYAVSIEAARDALGIERYDELHNRGANLSFEEAIGFLLDR